MLKGKQKMYLRGLANTLKSLFQVGKEGVNDNTIICVDNALRTHELIKINLLKTCDSTPKEVAIIVSKATRSEIVQIIGKTIVLYRRNLKEPKIMLP